MGGMNKMEKVCFNAFFTCWVIVNRVPVCMGLETPAK